MKKILTFIILSALTINIYASEKLELYDRLFKNTRPILANKKWQKNERIFLIEVTKEKDGIIISERSSISFFINQSHFLKKPSDEDSFNEIPIQYFFSNENISCLADGEISDFGSNDIKKYNICTGIWYFSGLIKLKVSDEEFELNIDRKSGLSLFLIEGSKSMAISPKRAIDGYFYSVKIAVYSEENYQKFGLKIFNKKLTEERFEVFSASDVNFGDFLDDDGSIFEMKKTNMVIPLSDMINQRSGLKDKIRKELKKQKNEKSGESIGINLI